MTTYKVKIEKIKKQKIALLIFLLISIIIHCSIASKGQNGTYPPERNFLINPDSENGGLQGRPCIAFDGTNFFVVWRVTSTSEIRGARVTPNGVVLDPAGITISYGTAPPSVVYDGTNYFVIWVNNEILAKRVNPDGKVIDKNDIQITTNGNPKIRQISLAYGGKYHCIVWRTLADEIYGIRVDKNGTALGDSCGFKIGNGFYPWIGFDGSDYLVVWHKWGNGLDIYGARISGDGRVLNPDGFPICAEDGDQDGASVTFGDSIYFVNWSDWRGGNEYNTSSVHGVRILRDGKIIDSTPIKIADYTRGEVPTVGSFDGDNFIVVWHEDNAIAHFRNVDVFGRRISQNGIVLDKKSIPISTSTYHQWCPRIGFNGEKYLVVWDDVRLKDGSDKWMLWGQLIDKRMLDSLKSSNQQLTEIPKSGKLQLNHYLETKWSAETSPTTNALLAIHGTDTTKVYISTSEFDVLKYNGRAWNIIKYVRNGKQFALWSFPKSHVWGTGWCWNVTHSDGLKWDDTNCLGWGCGFGMCGTDSTDIVIVGDVKQACRLINGQWTDIPANIKETLWDVWADDGGQYYSVGEYGHILRLNNTNNLWEPLPGIPTNQSLNGIWGNGANDIFVVGDNGTILHYDGISWKLQNTVTTEHLFGVWGFNSNHVFAVGLNGTILQYDGIEWKSDSIKTAVNLFDVWGFGNNIWAVGDKGTILKCANLGNIPQIKLSTNILDFGNNNIKNIQDKTVSIINPGTDELIVNNIICKNKAFKIIPTSFRVPPKGTVNIKIQFTPDLIKYYSDVISIESNAGNPVVFLRGNGICNPLIENINKSICKNDSIFLSGSFQKLSGIYYDTLYTKKGCDSIVITNLSVNPVYNINESKAICQGQSYQGWTTSGTYQRKLQTRYGCDSLVTTILKVNPVQNVTENISICTGQSYNGWTSPGSYKRILQTKTGCDSIVTTILTVNPVFNITENKTICQGQNYNGWTTTGKYSRTIKSKSGCDSIVTTNLTVNPSYSITENKNICQGQSYYGWTKSGTYQRKLQSKYACDSVVTTILKVNLNYNIKENMYICQGQSYNGWITTGTFKRTLQSIFGCDSIVSTDLTVFPSYNPIIIAHGDTLKAIRQYKTYQWYNESGVIAGATTDRYVISKSGKYRMVIKDENGCTNTSEVINAVFSKIKISKYENFRYSIIPNPNIGQFTFRIDSNPVRDLTLKLVNPLGQVIEIRPVKSAGVNHIEQFDISYLSKGMYYLIISSDKYQGAEKIVVQ